MTTTDEEDSEITQDDIDAANEEVDDFICRVMDATEDFLWTRGVDVHNTEPRKEGEDDEVIIYGHDYEALYGDFLEDYTKFLEGTEKGYRDAYFVLLEDLISSLENFLSVRKVSLNNREPRSSAELDNVIYGNDYADLYSDYYEVTSTELYGC